MGEEGSTGVGEGGGDVDRGRLVSALCLIADDGPFALAAVLPVNGSIGPRKDQARKMGILNNLPGGIMFRMGAGLGSSSESHSIRDRQLASVTLRPLPKGIFTLSFAATVLCIQLTLRCPLTTQDTAEAIYLCIC